MDDRASQRSAATDRRSFAIGRPVKSTISISLAGIGILLEMTPKILSVERRTTRMHGAPSHVFRRGVSPAIVTFPSRLLNSQRPGILPTNSLQQRGAAARRRTPAGRDARSNA